MKVMITGHRPERLGERINDVYNWIDTQFAKLGLENIEECITGCAKGVDTIFADCVIHNSLPLVCAFPYKHALSEPEQIMRDCAKEVYFQTEEWYKACYLDRDKWMVDRTDVVLVVWDGIPKGGTYYTKKYAEDKGKTVILFPWES